MDRRLLFLCTGNYYRSRFAEILFNALAAEARLPWRASSRGVALEKGVNNVGPISRQTLKALEARCINLDGVDRNPLQVQEHDFHQADMIIALQEAEHRPYLLERYPAWVAKVTYWHVRDVDPTPTYNPLQVIETETRRLIPHLAQAEEGR